MTSDSALTGALPGRPNVALVHEWVAARAGSEQVFEALAKLLPGADLFALSVEPGVNLETNGRPIRTTFLDRDMLRGRRGLSLPLMPAAWRLLGRGEYDVVVSSHHAFASSNRLTGNRGLHIAYVHTPARYVWTPELDERGAHAALVPARAMLRGIDARAARRLDHVVANSNEVADRIRQFWGRDADIVFPPVRVDFFAGRSEDPRPTRDYVLGFGRWIPYKNLHLVVAAADRAGLPVKIAGRGPDRPRIEAAAERARVPVEIIESPSDEQLRLLYRNAACLVFPTVEDFGIIPVEALAAGTPVVAPRRGGARDTVRDGVTGVLVDSFDIGDLGEAIEKALLLDPTHISESASAFSAQRFATERAAVLRRATA